MPPREDSPADLSASLKGLLRGRTAKLNIGEVVQQFEDHGGLAQVLFILTLPVLLPLPPGASMVLALPLLIVAPQMVAGRKDLWLPHWLADRGIERKSIAKLARRILPPLEWIEGLGKPRLPFIVGPLGTRIVGVAASILALILVLPIPFANLLPSIAVCLFALGLARKDGLMVLSGYLAFVVALGVIALGAGSVIFLFHWLKAMV